MSMDEVILRYKRGLLDYTVEEALKTLSSETDSHRIAELNSIISEIMFKKGQYTDAVNYGELSIDAEPAYAAGYSNLGWAEYWLGRNDDAAGHIEKAVELSPDVAEFHYRLGSVYNNALRKLPEAELQFTSAVQLDPQHELAYQQRGICRYNQGKYEEAESDYRRAAELGDPYSAYCLSANGSPIETAGEKLALSRDYWAQNDTTNAIELLKESLEEGFESPERNLEACLELADKCSVAKLNEDAEHYYHRAINEHPDSADAYGRRGWHFYINSQDDRSEADLRRAMELDSDDSIHSAHLANLYAVSGRPESGLEVLEPAMANDPLSSDLFYARALCNKALDRVEESKEDFRTASLLGHRSALNDRRTAFGNEYPIDFFSQGIELGENNDLSGAAEQFRKAADMFGERIKYHGDKAYRYRSKSLHNLGYYLHASGGSADEAKAAVGEALEMDPGYKDAWITLGNIHNSLGENERAMECYSRAIEIQPNDGRGYYSRGRIYMAREEWDRGVSDFTSAVNLYSRRDWKGDAFYNRARCHEGAGRVQEAVADYNEAFNHGIQQAIQESFRLKDQYGLE